MSQPIELGVGALSVVLPIGWSYPRSEAKAKKARLTRIDGCALVVESFGYGRGLSITIELTSVFTKADCLRLIEHVFAREPADGQKQMTDNWKEQDEQYPLLFSFSPGSDLNLTKLVEDIDRLCPLMGGQVTSAESERAVLYAAFARIEGLTARVSTLERMLNAALDSSTQGKKSNGANR
jgi:hypothetical protein